MGNGFDGLGFVLTAKDPYCIIDLDQAENAEQYELINKTFMDLRSYTELSPSGTGLHVVTKADLAACDWKSMNLHGKDGFRPV